MTNIIKSDDCLHNNVGTIIDDMENGEKGQQWRCLLCDHAFIPFPNPIVLEAIMYAVRTAVKVAVSYLSNTGHVDPRLIPIGAHNKMVQIVLSQLRKK